MKVLDAPGSPASSGVRSEPRSRRRPAPEAAKPGNVKRPRGFYIIDRSVPVGFKPGEDLNVEKTIRVQRRIE